MTIEDFKFSSAMEIEVNGFIFPEHYPLIDAHNDWCRAVNSALPMSNEFKLAWIDSTWRKFQDEIAKDSCANRFCNIHRPKGGS